MARPGPAGQCRGIGRPARRDSDLRRRGPAAPAGQGAGGPAARARAPSGTHQRDDQPVSCRSRRAARGAVPGSGCRGRRGDRVARPAGPGADHAAHALLPAAGQPARRSAAVPVGGGARRPAGGGRTGARPRLPRPRRRRAGGDHLRVRAARPSRAAQRRAAGELDHARRAGLHRADRGRLPPGRGLQAVLAVRAAPVRRQPDGRLRRVPQAIRGRAARPRRGGALALRARLPRAARRGAGRGAAAASRVPAHGGPGARAGAVPASGGDRHLPGPCRSAPPDADPAAGPGGAAAQLLHLPGRAPARRVGARRHRHTAQPRRRWRAGRRHLPGAGGCAGGGGAGGGAAGGTVHRGGDRGRGRISGFRRPRVAAGGAVAARVAVRGGRRGAVRAHHGGGSGRRARVDRRAQGGARPQRVARAVLAPLLPGRRPAGGRRLRVPALHGRQREADADGGRGEHRTARPAPVRAVGRVHPGLRTGAAAPPAPGGSRPGGGGRKPLAGAVVCGAHTGGPRSRERPARRAVPAACGRARHLQQPDGAHDQRQPGRPRLLSRRGRHRRGALLSERGAGERSADRRAAVLGDIDRRVRSAARASPSRVRPPGRGGAGHARLPARPRHGAAAGRTDHAGAGAGGGGAGVRAGRLLSARPVAAPPLPLRPGPRLQPAGAACRQRPA